MLRTDPAYAAKAARVSALAATSREYLATLGLAGRRPRRPASPSPITPPARCSTASRSTREPKDLLCSCGFVVKDVPEGHLCCGSAGTYNILQPDIAARGCATARSPISKRLAPDVIAAGNIGCITQIAAGTAIPVVHTVELIDWATGGPVPEQGSRSWPGLDARRTSR